MKIVVDLQGCQTQSRYRGIGRYSLAVAKALVRNNTKHDIFIILSALFPETLRELQKEFEGLLPKEHIKVWHAPQNIKQSETANKTNQEVAQLLRESFLNQLQPDIVLVSSFFEGFVDDAALSIKKLDKHMPTAVISYDLIPYIHPKLYLEPNRKYKDFYLQRLEDFKKADFFIGISESSAAELSDYLDVEKTKVISAAAGMDEDFIKLKEESKQTDLKKFGISREMVLYVPGGFDERKNFKRLIEAFSKLSLTLRERHQLVIVSKIDEHNRQNLLKIAKKSGLCENDLILTGYVDDKELLGLYQQAKLFVFPSIHEGFGLPVLEAMHCGAPTIGSNTTSIPEVIGLKEALFDPYSVDSIAQKMQHALEDDAFLNHLKKHIGVQIQKFSWDAGAKVILQELETLSPKRADFISRKELLDALAKVIPSGYKDEKLQKLAVCIEKNEQEAKCCRGLLSQIRWRIEGPFDSSYSLALLNRQTALALEELGHDVALFSTEGPGDFEPDAAFLKQNLKINELYKKSHTLTQNKSDVSSRNLYPPRVEDMHAPCNLLHHYAWEESAFPSEWAESFNASLDGITTLSSHVHKVMIDNGVSLPLATSGCGVDHWQSVETDVNYTLSTTKSFRFLHVSSCFPRKGVDVLLKAYARRFSGKDDVVLIIKTFENPHNEAKKWLQTLQEEHTDFPEVILIEEDLTQNALKALYEQCDVLVGPSRAEGFGLPFAEAMLSNLGVITTGWSGQLDFCTPQTAWLIDYTFTPAQTHFELFDSVWAEPSQTHLEELMYRLFTMPKEQRLVKTQKAKELLLQKFRWSDVASRLVQAARGFSSKPYRNTLKLGWISSYNTKCGIATYSQHLTEHLNTECSVLASYTDETLHKDAHNVYRCWHTEDDMQHLSQTIEKLQLEALVIQFNYGFFELEKLNTILLEQKAKNRVVVIVLHATTDPLHAPRKKLSKIVTGLQQCDRVLVHSIADLNRLKEQGIVENVALFPHGILDYTPKQHQRNKVFTIASYGFFLPHKGLLELIEAVAGLRKKGIALRLKMVNALYPAPESAELLKKAQQKVEELGIAPYVEFHTDFLSDEESLELLSSADMLIFAYQETGESASGAVRYGLVAQKPVLVTPLPIFDDVQKAVLKLPGTSVKDIQDGIEYYMQKIKTDDKEIAQNKKDAKRWREAHLYTHLAQRLENMIISLKNNTDKGKIQ